MGPNGLVVLWLKVEGFTALGLPLLSILVLAMALNEVWAVSCFLYVLALFQAGWLVLGCVWAFSGVVPAECRAGGMGDRTAFNVLWWVCGVWLGTMAVITLVITLLVCFLAGASAAPTSGRGSGGYAKLSGGGDSGCGSRPASAV